MNQVAASTDPFRPQRGFTVAAPHDWDGIGQALRSAYRDHHKPPADICAMLEQLDSVD